MEKLSPYNIICNNFLIYAKICRFIANLKPLTLTVVHVKGNQDTHQSKDHQLTLPECLNIDHDGHAASLPQPDNNWNIYMNPE